MVWFANGKFAQIGKVKNFVEKNVQGFKKEMHRTLDAFANS